MSNVKTKDFTIKQLVIEVEGEEFFEKDDAYEFTGRTFKDSGEGSGVYEGGDE